MRGGGSKAVWNFSENSSVLVASPVHKDDEEESDWKATNQSQTQSYLSVSPTIDQKMALRRMMMKMRSVTGDDEVDQNISSIKIL